MKRFLPLFLLVLLTAACDDDIATSADVQPTPSVDTLRLGMVLVDNPSPTYGLKLYNRNSREIQLTSITLRNAQTSGFRMNVDGMNGTAFTQSELLRIASGDSLFMFVEATFPQNTQKQEQRLDYIDVLCNGKTTTVVLEALSRDVKKLRAYVVENDETWQAEEVQVYDSLVVAEGATLTLLDSTTLYLHDKADLIVYGSLVAKGSLERPVTIRGDRTDWMFEETLPYDNLPSQWGSLYLREGSTGNVFEWTNIHGMSEGIFVEGAAQFLSCHIKNSDGNLLSCRNAEVEITNCELMNSALSLLEVVGGSCEVVHSTLANFNFASLVRQDVLHLTNLDTLTNEVAPLYRCDFINTIIKGKEYMPHIFLDYVEPEAGDSIFCYRFDHCWLSEDGADDEDFISVKWNEEPLFSDSDPARYFYDTHLHAESSCIGAGNPDAVHRAPFDLDGKPRSATPSIGCYEPL